MMLKTKFQKKNPARGYAEGIAVGIAPGKIFGPGSRAGGPESL
jgi:hypothetical protein